jgi:hypothetical protein
MNLDIGATLSRAWRITWNNKILWLLGILAGCGGGSGNFQFRGGGGGGGGGVPGGQPGNLPPEIQRFFDQLDPSVVTAVVIGLICLGLLLALVAIALGVIGRGGLIGGVQRANAQGKVSFGEAWNIGLKHFWTLFIIGLVVGLVTFLAVVLTVVPGAIFTAVTFGLGALCLVPLICVLSILSIILGIVAYFAQIAAVVENLGVSAALSRAWQIIQANLGSIIVLGLILIVLSGIIGFVLALPFIAIVVPAVFGFIALANGDAPALGNTSLIVAGLCFVIYLPILILLQGILQTWVTAAWTLAYEQFTGRSASGVPAAPAAPAM